MNTRPDESVSQTRERKRESEKEKERKRERAREGERHGKYASAAQTPDAAVATKVNTQWPPKSTPRAPRGDGSPQSGTKSLFSDHCFVLALANCETNRGKGKDGLRAGGEVRKRGEDDRCPDHHHGQRQQERGGVVCVRGSGLGFWESRDHVCALKLIAPGKLTCDERSVVHRGKNGQRQQECGGGGLRSGLTFRVTV